MTFEATEYKHFNEHTALPVVLCIHIITTYVFGRFTLKSESEGRGPTGHRRRRAGPLRPIFKRNPWNIKHLLDFMAWLEFQSVSERLRQALNAFVHVATGYWYIRHMTYEWPYRSKLLKLLTGLVDVLGFLYLIRVSFCRSYLIEWLILLINLVISGHYQNPNERKHLKTELSDSN